MVKLKPKYIWGKWVYDVVGEHQDNLRVLTGKPSVNTREIEALKALGVQFQIDTPDGLLPE